MRWRGPILIFLIVTGFYWKLTLSRQYTFLESLDQADQVLPWLDLVVNSIRHGQIPLWTPYELYGQPLLAQVSPSVVSPFVWVLALTPLRDGHLQIPWVHLWFVFIHLVGALLAYWFLRELELDESPSILGASLFATMGYYGSTDWPHLVATAIWAPAIFLFLFRAIRGRSRIANSALAGMFTGIAWLCGYHVPPIYFTLTVVAIFAWVLVTRRPSWRDAAQLVVPYVVVLGLVSAVQVLPASEYGRLALRYTASGALHWNDRVGYPEHVGAGFDAKDILHLVIQGADKQAEPYTGVVALSLAVLAMATLFRRVEVRVFGTIAVSSLLLSMPKNFFVYGLLYSLVPMFEKARAPSLMMCVFHFAIAVLAAFGLGQLMSGTAPTAVRRMAKTALAFGCVVYALMLLADFAHPTVAMTYFMADPRPAVFALLALLFGAVCVGQPFLAAAGFQPAVTANPGLRRKPLLLPALVILLALVEQGNVAGYNWVHNSETGRKTFLRPIDESRSLAEYLRRHQPSRAEINTQDFGSFNFGDWYRIPTTSALVPTVLISATRLGWWSERTTKLFGVRYTISRNPTRPGQVEVFANPQGMKIFENPDVLPRAWTVHATRQAPNIDVATSTVFDERLDLGREAVLVGPPPSLETCGKTDSVRKSRFDLQRVEIEVEMGCRGLLLVSDAWFPGWTATVDGTKTPIREADGGLRAIEVPGRHHTIKMRYQPTSVYAGFALSLCGFGLAALLASRRERPGEDLFPAKP